MTARVRYWRTGGIATVMAAATQQAPAPPALSVSQRSPYSLQETVERLRRAAPQHGLHVYAHLASLQGGRRGTLLVLGGADDETPVLQQGFDAALQLPLSMRIEPRGDGAAEVRYVDGVQLAALDGLPSALHDQVAALAGLVAATLERRRAPRE